MTADLLQKIPRDQRYLYVRVDAEVGGDMTAAQVAETIEALHFGRDPEQLKYVGIDRHVARFLVRALRP